MLNKKMILMTILLALCFTPVHTQEHASSEFDSLAMDNSIRYGRLANGFTYFLKSIPEPGSKLYLRLYNKAGANQEGDDQDDMAHAIEHFAFKPTIKFPSGIKNNDQVIRMKMGMYDFAGNTGRKGVTYYFDAPEGKKEAVKIGFLWFKDIIQGLILNKENINSVRGELRQELIHRNGDNLNDHFTKSKLLSLLFPCEQDESNFFVQKSTFEPEILKGFYREWYRPDLMGLSAVGNIRDLNGLEAQIKQSFSDIEKPENSKNLKNCDVLFYNRAPQFFKVERALDSSKVFQNNAVDIKLIFRDSITNKNLHTVEGSKFLILNQMMVNLINGRFREATNDYASFQLGSRYLYSSKELPPALEVEMQLENISEKHAIERTIYLLRQIREHGATDREWETIKQEQLQFLNDEVLRGSTYWNNEISKYFLAGEAFPANEQALLRPWLTKLHRIEFNRFVRKFLSKMPEDLGIIVPNGNKALSYTEKEVRSWIERSYYEPSQPYSAPTEISSLLTKGEVKELEGVGYIEKGPGASGAREIVLENGAKVIFKSYTSLFGRRPRINLHGFSLKGANCFSKEDYFSAINAPAIMWNAGINDINRFRLNRFLANTSLRPGGIVPYVGNEETGIQSDAEIEDLETILQLIFLFFTKANKDRLAFEDWKLKEFKAFQDPSYDLSDKDFRNAIMESLGESAESSFLGRKFINGTKRFEGVEKTDFDVSYNAYRKLFGNSKDFTFIISGAFDVEVVMPLVQKYLGNLPNSYPIFRCAPSSVDKDTLPKASLVVEVPAPEYYQMKNWNYGVRFFEEAEDPSNWKEQLKVQALGGIMNNKVWDLRFKKGYSLYVVGAVGRFDEDKNRYEIASTLSCTPKEFPMIQNELKRIVTEIKSGIISKDEFQQGLQRMYSLYDPKRADHPRVMEQNLYNHYRYNLPWLDPVEVDTFVKELSVVDIVETAQEYLQDENFYEFLGRDKE